MPIAQTAEPVLLAPERHDARTLRPAVQLTKPQQDTVDEAVVDLLAEQAPAVEVVRAMNEGEQR